MMTLDNRHTLALPYWARPGIAAFAKKATDDGEGGADDQDDDDEEDDEEEDDDDEDDDLAELSEDELRAELKKTRESLSKASGSSKAKRDRIKKLNRELAEARKQKSKEKADDDEKLDAETIKAAAKAEARAESDTRIKKTTVRAELKAAGIPADQATRLIGLIDLDSLDVDDDGEVDGLDEAIEDLKAAWPQLFNVKPIKRQRQSVAGGKGDDTPKKLTPSQIQAARATGKRAS